MGALTRADLAHGLVLFDPFGQRQRGVNREQNRTRKGRWTTDFRSSVATGLTARNHNPLHSQLTIRPAPSLLIASDIASLSVRPLPPW